jgi:TIR domain
MPGAPPLATEVAGGPGKASAILSLLQSDLAIKRAGMGRIEKTVFISYRRADEPWALAVFEDLSHHGYDVFIDYDGIASGAFATVILENIKARAHFLILLTPTALERSRDPEDWMRREIEVALDSQRNIVPLMLESFEFGSPAIAAQLTGKLAALKHYNGLQIPKGYFSAAMERLRNKFLSVSVDMVLHPASLSAQQAATSQKGNAARALLDEHREGTDSQPAWNAELLKKKRWSFIIAFHTAKDHHKLAYVPGFFYGQLELDGVVIRKFRDTGMHMHQFEVSPHFSRFEVSYSFNISGIDGLQFRVDNRIILSTP